MDGHNNSTQDPNPKEYKSRPGALAWFFRKSRDGWKRKYRDLKITVKGLKNRIADLTKSREQWRTKAEQAGQRLANVEAENAELRARIAEAEEKKRTRGRSTELYPDGARRAAGPAVCRGGSAVVPGAGA